MSTFTDVNIFWVLSPSIIINGIFWGLGLSDICSPTCSNNDAATQSQWKYSRQIPPSDQQLLLIYLH